MRDSLRSPASLGLKGLSPVSKKVRRGDVPTSHQAGLHLDGIRRDSQVRACVFFFVPGRRWKNPTRWISPDEHPGDGRLAFISQRDGCLSDKPYIAMAISIAAHPDLQRSSAPNRSHPAVDEHPRASSAEIPSLHLLIPSLLF